jgi:hypothetical protein
MARPGVISITSAAEISTNAVSPGSVFGASAADASTGRRLEIAETMDTLLILFTSIPPEKIDAAETIRRKACQNKK